MNGKREFFQGPSVLSRIFLLVFRVSKIRLFGLFFRSHGFGCGFLSHDYFSISHYFSICLCFSINLCFSVSTIGSGGFGSDLWGSDFPGEFTGGIRTNFFRLLHFT